MTLLVHNKTKKSEETKKILYYKGKVFNHLVIFDAIIEHALLVKGLLRHFKLTDNNCQAGLLLENKIIFYTEFEKFYNITEL